MAFWGIQAIKKILIASKAKQSFEFIFNDD
jgi:hypothetical protein